MYIFITRSHTLTVTEEDEKKDSAGGIILLGIYISGSHNCLHLQLVSIRKTKTTKRIPKLELACGEPRTKNIPKNI